METNENSATRPSAYTPADRVADVINEAASKAKPTIDRLAARAHDAVDKAASAAAPAAEWVRSQGHDFAAMEKKFVDDACGYVSAIRSSRSLSPSLQVWC